MQDAKEGRLRRISDTPQEGAIAGNAADGALMVDQGNLNLSPCSLVSGAKLKLSVRFFDP
ncbi:MAG: hypothetical protein JW882_13635 [Deltaproteobacteria bacterium]|nr:hypothetical protein [Deltaproteobacteria bacterium]